MLEIVSEGQSIGIKGVAMETTKFDSVRRPGFYDILLNHTLE